MYVLGCGERVVVWEDPSGSNGAPTMSVGLTCCAQQEDPTEILRHAYSGPLLWCAV